MKNIIIIVIAVVLILNTPAFVYGENEGIEGDWNVTLSTLDISFVLQISMKPDGTLAAATEGKPFDKVTFENGKLHLEGGSPRSILEGMIKEDGLTIEGQWQQGEQQWPVVLTRVEQVRTEAEGRDDSQAVQASEKQLQDRNELGESAVNRVLSLDGKGDYVRIANSQSLRSFTEAITIEVWLRASSFFEEDRYINSVIRKNVTRSSENFFLRFRTLDGKRHLAMSVSYDIQELLIPYDFALDTWYHLAGTYDGNAITIFINGVSVESVKASGTMYLDDSDIFIGKGDPDFCDGEHFHGSLDEIRIWNIARSPEEIRANMNKTLTGKEEGLVVYLNFDDGTAKDLSPNGNDGLLGERTRIIKSSFPVSTALSVQKADKLVAWWKFDDNTNNSIGTIHGTISGNPTYTEGKFGKAISLDGDDYIDCGNPSSLNFGTGDWTVSAWIKTTQSGADDANEPNRGTVFANGGDEAGGIRYTLAVNEGQSGMITLTTDDDLSKIQAISKTAVNDDAWHHVVGMRNGKKLHVYVDGVLEVTKILPAGYSLSDTSQQNACIGVIADNRDSSLIKYFVGLIDEVCIFACALNADNVRALYSGRNPVKVAQEAIIATTQTSGEQLENAIPGRSRNIVTTLILVVGLAGVIGGIVFFLVKSSIVR